MKNIYIYKQINMRSSYLLPPPMLCHSCYMQDIVVLSINHFNYAINHDKLPNDLLRVVSQRDLF